MLSPYLRAGYGHVRPRLSRLSHRSRLSHELKFHRTAESWKIARVKRVNLVNRQSSIVNKEESEQYLAPNTADAKCREESQSVAKWYAKSRSGDRGVFVLESGEVSKNFFLVTIYDLRFTILPSHSVSCRERAQ